MKWIGQNIYDLIARFRSDVYLEGLSTTTETNVLVVDSNGKISKSTTLADDIIESEIDTLAGLTSFGAAGATTNIAAGDLTMYNAVNDGNPTISLGSAATERLEIKAQYESGAQGLDVVKFITHTEGSSANDSRFAFEVDETSILQIKDAGLNLTASMNLSIGNIDILADSSGTTTLSNIDALDATTEATIESAIDTLGNLTSASSLATVGTISTGVWQGTAIATAYIADDAVTFAKASGVSPKVYGSKIKLLPTDFEANEDGGATKTMQFDDTAPTGIKPGATATELLAFASIPEGMKATHVDIYAAQNLTMECFELNVNASGLTSKGSGTTNTTLDITDVNATATNYIMIIVTTTATSDRVWGGEITIAAQ